MPESNYLISVGKDMIEVLETFVTRNEPLGITQLAKELKMSKNKIFRILYTWKDCGYIQKREYSEMYELGPKILELARKLECPDR
ncbi:MAG: helix-turn-helix domain-containing protein [bacterium]|nr:helix-turn-helix domain-containing protein [bacterium]